MLQVLDVYQATKRGPDNPADAPQHQAMSASTFIYTLGGIFGSCLTSSALLMVYLLIKSQVRAP